MIMLRQGAGKDPAVTAPLMPFLARLKQTSGDVPLMKAGPGGPEIPGRDSIRDGTASPGSAVPTIPGYEIVSELGRGGMGVVYKARQLGLNRLVALKMVLAGPHAQARELTRFRQEAEAVARLHHPNIIQVFDIGEAEGIAYFALEYVEEGSLVQRLRGDPQALESSVRLIETLASAVHFAHRRGIVHRDLKPANILLAGSAAGDLGHKEFNLAYSPATYQPKIADFGLAKRIDEKGSRAQSVEVVGTPSYMAPEQAAGKAHLLGPATDVYALGAILYEMLTGRPPFKGATPLDTIVQVLHEEPVRPSRLRPSLPRDLENICLKCLNKEPARRYSSAALLADDLQRYRKGKPIMARPVGPVERSWKWARRRPLAAALLAGMILSVVLGFAGVTWQWQEARRARDIALEEKRDKEVERLQAEYARAEADGERSRTKTALYYSRIAQSQLQWQVNDVNGAMLSLAKCVPLADHEDRRGWEWHYLLGLFHSDLFTLSHPNPGEGGNAIFQPDGRSIVSVVGGNATDDDAHPGELRVWDAAAGSLMTAYSVRGTAHRLVIRPDGERLALATTNGALLILEAATGKELVSRPPTGHMTAGLAFSPDGKALALASWDGTVKLCNADTGEVSHTLLGHSGRVHSVVFHPDGLRLASAGWDETVRIWEAVTGKEIMTLRGHKSPVYGVAFSPDGKLLASAGSNGNLRIWELATGRSIQSLTPRLGAVLSTAFSPDSRYLAYSGGDGTVRVWDVESGIERVIFRGHTAPVESVQFSPDSQRLVSASPQQGAVKVWDFTRPPEQAIFARVRGRADQIIKVRDLTGRAETAVLARTGPDIEALAFHADGRKLVSVAVGGKLQTWDASSGLLEDQLSLPMCDELVSPAVLAAFNPGGTRIAGRAREDDRLVKVWNVADGKEVGSFRAHTLPVLCVRFSSDGRKLVTCASDPRAAGLPHEIMVWEAATGNRLATLTGQGLVMNTAFSPDGHALALGTHDGKLWLMEWEGPGRMLSLVGHKGPVAAIAFSRDGKLLASAGVEDRTLKFWALDGLDVATATGPRAVHTVAVPPFVCDLAFSLDGQRLAGISRDALKMWDVGTGHEVLTLKGAPQRHWDPAFNPRVAFSPDGKHLVGTNWDESISMWDAVLQDDENTLARHQLARRQAADARATLWHLQEAEDCVEHANPAAARFHLQRLGNAPLPPPLHARKERLASQLTR
jgi:WD40 repeat protein/tRNA A-37 threonylcarbamoyl transferase component Bud32